MKCLMTNNTPSYSMCMWICYMYMLHRRVFIVTCCNYGESSVSISSINIIFRIYYTAIGLDPRYNLANEASARVANSSTDFFFKELFPNVYKHKQKQMFAKFLFVLV